MAGEIKYTIVEHLGVINERAGFKKEVNLVSWNEGNPKIDIREWNEDHTKLTKGITLSLSECKKIKALLDKIDFSDIE